MLAVNAINVLFFVTTKDLEEQVQKLKGQKSPYVISNIDNAILKFVESYIESSR
jgi:hypothetical protein